jgi:hypothetical protein
LTAAEAIARARALVPVLSERAAKTEALHRLPDETFADLLESGISGGYSASILFAMEKSGAQELIGWERA